MTSKKRSLHFLVSTSKLSGCWWRGTSVGRQLAGSYVVLEVYAYGEVFRRAVTHIHKWRISVFFVNVKCQAVCCKWSTITVLPSLLVSLLPGFVGVLCRRARETNAAFKIPRSRWRRTSCCCWSVRSYWRNLVESGRMEVHPLSVSGAAEVLSRQSSAEHSACALLLGSPRKCTQPAPPGLVSAVLARGSHWERINLRSVVWVW